MVRAGYKQTEVGEIPGDWNVFSLQSVCAKITDGTHDTPKPTKEGVPYLTAIHVKPNFINYDECYYLPQSIHNEIYKRCNPQKNDVLMVNIGAGVATTALVTVDFEFSLKNVALLKPNESKLESSYLNQYHLYRKEAIVTSLLSGGAQPFLSLGQISKIKIALPATKFEQKAISKALSDVDELIVSLEKLIAKKRDIKTATMQQLLTGKKRLPGFAGKWSEVKINDVAHIDPENLSSSTKPDYEFKYISLEDVDRGVLSAFSHQMFKTSPSRARRVLKYGDVLLSTVRPNLKSHLLFDESGDDWVCSTGFSVIRCDLNKSVPEFVYYHLFGGFIEKQIETLISGSNYPAINSGDVRGLIIPIPEVKEQKAISIILADMDAELNSLTFQLDKTKAIKQGMMQELLTGRTRLIEHGSKVNG